ncbi:MAG: TrmH family RNA methyltransferase [Candidatus Flexifilum sp.]|jgi:TrmH family RNA methyltransferase
MITSFHNERVKLAHALQNQARARRKEDRIALEGVRLLRDALLSGLRPDFILYDPTVHDPAALLTDGIAPEIAAHALLNAFPAAPEILRHLADTETPQGVIGVFPTPAVALPRPLDRLLILDAIRDPGNLGTILRTAAGAGVGGVLLAPGCADAWNPKALRAGMGAHFRIAALEANWPRIAVLCADLTVVLADMQGERTYDAVDWRAPWALIIGSEAHGASPEAERLARLRAFIPLANATESINAAAAAAVFLFEAARQRRA